MGKGITSQSGRGTRSTSSRVQRSRRGRIAESGPQGGELSVELIDEAGQAVAFECFDLSAVGVYLYSDLLLSPGEIVHLRLKLPWSLGPVHVRGEVVRAEHEDGAQSPGMGVAFRDLGAEVEAELKRYVARRFFRHATAR
jgi:hypothetical protein